MYNGVTFNLGTLLTGFYSVASGVVPVFFHRVGAEQLGRAAGARATV
jgi:hypothetical protein